MNDQLTGFALVAPQPERFATHRLYPTSDRPRLILPKANSCASTATMMFQNPRQRWISKASSLADMLKGSRQWFIEALPMVRLRERLAMGNNIAAISLGTPGPYNKPTILFMDPRGAPLLIVKVGLHAASQALLRNEAEWLGRVERLASRSSVAPRLIGSGMEEGLYFVAQSVGTGKNSDRKLTEVHIEFLKALQNIDAVEWGFEDSAMHLGMHRRLRGLEGVLGKEWRARLYASIELLEKRLSGGELPMVAAHRDFVPWNMKTQAEGFLVYDWEYASVGYCPLYDLYHYSLMPMVLNNRLLNEQTIERIVRTVVYHAGGIDHGSEKVNQPEAQLLAYLADLCLYYLESNGGVVHDNSVVKHYGEVIDRLRDNKER